jgi:hypothetical protein
MTLPCIKCGEEAAIRVDVQDGDTLTCCGCDAEYTVEDVEQVIAEWREILPWLKAHPRRVPAPQAAGEVGEIGAVLARSWGGAK